MKYLNSSIITGFILILFFNSCTIEKKVYLSGYHIRWKRTKNHTKKEHITHIDRSSLISTNETKFIAETANINTNSDIENVFWSESKDENITASLDKNLALFTSNKFVSAFNKSQSFKSALTNKETIAYSKKGTIKSVSNKRIIIKEGTGMSATSMLILGWVFTGLAILSLLILWPLIFFLIPGLYFLIVGYKKKNGTSISGKKSGPSGEMQDVIYLKNGSIIRGLIIEQIPNVSLKIQTADGSVFVYKIDEIEKMTKELSK